MLFSNMAEIIYTLTAIPFGICTLLLFFQYRHQKNQFVIYFGFTWFFLMLWTLIQALAYVFDSAILFRIHILTLIPSGLFEILALDAISRESIDRMKIIIITGISTVIFANLFNNDAIHTIVTINHEISFTPRLDIIIEVGILAYFIGMLYIYNMGLICKNAPQKLKKGAIFNLIGAILLGLGIPTIAALELDKILFPGLDGLIGGIGAMFCAISFYRYPQLAFILPFKTSQIRIMNLKSGMYLYIHKWEEIKDDANDGVFSGLLHAISAILNETLHQGNVKEIHLDNGILLLQKCTDPNIVVVLIASKSSKILRVALEQFSNEFNKQFPDCSLDTTGKIDQYKKTDELVRKIFWFIHRD